MADYDDSSDVQISADIVLPKSSVNVRPPASPLESASATIATGLPSKFSASSSDVFLDKNTHYPLQKNPPYLPPTCTLSTESKRVIRQAQDPLWTNNPRAAHFLYEVNYNYN